MVRLASLTAAGLLFAATSAIAAEPVQLTSSQLDGVTAGQPGLTVGIDFAQALGGAFAAGPLSLAFSNQESDASVPSATSDNGAFSLFGVAAAAGSTLASSNDLDVSF
jgi:hypothetical protein